MATFKIHEDAEKENPPMQSVVRDKLSVLQPLVNGGGAGGMGKMVGAGTAPIINATLKDKQIRGHFSTLNTKYVKNDNIAPGVGAPIGGGGSKVAFREVSNVKGTEKEINGKVGGVKKSTVVPVVEQFKAFSVYENKTNGQMQQLIFATGTENVTAKIDINKENVCINEKHEDLLYSTKNASMQRDFSITSSEYSLEGTPMSISDVLSPMSVDRSQIEKPIMEDLHDVSDDKKIAKNLTEQIAIPRNDRQRFFEVVEYQRDILEYFRESEQKHRPKPHYMQRQTDINHTMRTILVDWLVEVSEEYNLDTETLYLAVFYIDRFLSHMSVVRSKLQLVGTAAMYIASKYEEIYPPDVSEFVFITDDTYTKSQVLRMEQIILKILTFDLCTPTAYAFLNTYSVVIDLPDNVKYLAQYLSELSLLEADPFLKYVPSKISASSVALARYLLQYPIWSLELQDCTSYRLEDLTEIIINLSKIHNTVGAMSQQAIPEKYKAQKYNQVTNIKAALLNEQSMQNIITEFNELLETNNEDDMIGGGDNQAMTTSSQNVKKMISLMFN